MRSVETEALTFRHIFKRTCDIQRLDQEQQTWQPFACRDNYSNYVSHIQVV